MTQGLHDHSHRVAPMLGIAAILAAAAIAHAGPAVTVYTRDLGFIREERALDLTRDRDTLMIPVPERIDFSSVRCVVPGARVGRLVYRYDVPSGDGALERARGSRVRVVMRGDRSIEGELIAVDGSWLVVREDDGALRNLSRTAIEDARLAPAVGSRFTMRPALEAVIEGKRGRVNAELSYLTGGLSWTAEHVLVRRGESGATWSTHVTVENTTGRDYEDAMLKLVAGEPNREGGAPAPVMAMRTMAMADGAMEKSDMTEQTFADYHLYTLDHPAALRDRETQRLAMYDPREIKVKPRYLYRGGDARGVQSQLEVLNATASGLGVPLPAGRVRFYETDPAGALQFTGEAHIAHTAEDEKLTLEVGTAFDLVAERKETYNKRISDREREYGVEIKLRNRKHTDVEIVVEESVSGDIELTQKNFEFTRKDANTLQFTIPVAAGKETVLRYVARARW